MPGPTILFSVATLAPLPLIALAAAAGGAWAVAAALWMSLLVVALDGLAGPAAPEAGGNREFPAADALCAAIGAAHLPLLAIAVAALAGGWLAAWEKAALFLAAGWYLGQVGNANAHEMIHRTGRWLPLLGRAVYVTLLFGHHASAHRLIHHRFVGTPRDPNTARRGEGVYRFFLRAWTGSFAAGWRAEAARLRQAGRPRWRHPYAGYLAGAAATCAAAVALAGPGGLAALVALAVFAQAQLLLSDYVQHYGLRRAQGADGRPEPVAPGHSWNSPHRFSSAMMLNAPRHSDHHAHPARPYPALRLPQAAPVLPHSLPVMSCLALWPAAWRRVMHPRLDALERPARHAAA